MAAVITRQSEHLPWLGRNEQLDLGKRVARQIGNAVLTEQLSDDRMQPIAPKHPVQFLALDPKPGIANHVALGIDR
jgi:hypothetical protein